MAFDPAESAADNNNDDEDNHAESLSKTVPRLRIDDAFDDGDEDDSVDVNGFDLKSFAGFARQEVAAAIDDDANSQSEDGLSSSVSNIGSSIPPRNGRAIPPPLTIVNTGPSSALPQLDDDDLKKSGRRELFEDVELSPPSTPVASTSLRTDQVPLAITEADLRSPLKSPSVVALNQSNAAAMRSVTSLSLADHVAAVRVVAPRPNYLSPTSTIPTPPEIDPVPQRAPSPSRAGSSKRLAENPHLKTRPSTAPGTRVIPGNHTGSTTSAALADKLLSKTRPAHLPPKPRSEDLKHQREFEEMMKKSRALEEERLRKEAEKKREREGRVEDAVSVWEREILPDWRRVLRAGKDSEKLRRMWWGGIPSKLRGRIWSSVIGNGLALSKDTYRTCLSRAKRALSSGTFPAETLAQIENDVRLTLPNLHIFHPEYGPMYQDLKYILCAWVVSRADEGLSYVRGASNIAAMFVLNMPVDQAFMSMRNLLERHCLRSFYGGEGSDDDLEAYYRIFDTLLADGMPKVYFNFKQHQVSPSLYLPSWVVPLFLTHLPFEMCARIWDVIILEGDAFVFRAAIAVLGILESRLFFPDRQELLEVLRGENKAALEIARRTGVSVDMSARYEQYGMSEQALWDRIAEMDEWWRESTWSRLITRELPDI